jgi:bifunctional non-homologous end joining protein LigD
MPGKLSIYHAKRNFGITPEPRGEIVAPSERLRFVVQKHDARKLHYDFRLELDGTLKSWAVPKGPSLDPGEKRLAVHVEDHPLDYIDFEGDIPEHQYGAGHVEVWDAGYWEPQGDPMDGYRAGKLKFHLDGEKLQGGWALVRTRLQASGDKEQWLLIKERDDEARSSREFDITEEMPDSVLSKPASKQTGRAKKRPAQPNYTAAATPVPDPSEFKNARKTPLPDMLAPQLATLVDSVPQDEGWMYELKFDGYRVLAKIADGEVRLFTRDGKDWTAKLAQQARAIKALNMESAWLDGEVVVLDKHGIPSFQLLQNAFNENGTASILYFLFDLPYLNGYDLRKVPLNGRRALLQHLLEGAADGLLRFSMPLDQPPQKLLDSACEISMEGIIGKRQDSIYTGKRSAEWIKLKCRSRQEFVIAGYTEPEGTRKFFGALLLGVYGDDGELRYAGRVGTGFDRSTLHAVYKQLKPLEQDRPAFKKLPAGVSRAKTHWVRPQLVAEISFSEWTHDGILRQAVFHGLRVDKPAAQVRREKAMSAPKNGARHAAQAVRKTARNNIVQETKITHPERVIDVSSGLTKLDLVHYYDQIAPRILPFLQNRPVYLLRAPEGVDGERFFQKHNNRLKIPGMGTLDPALDPEHAPLMAIGSAHALIGAAQMGMVELHTCNATADRFDRPDCMVFDLDPDPDLPWAAVIDGAQLTKVVLDELGLKSFLKTSGGKGLHLVVPLARRHDWDEVATFSQAVAQHLARTIPKRFSAKMGEKNRIGKIFIDYMRNRQQASTVVPYSVRAKPGLPVATPIAWEELKDTTGSAMWTVTSLAKRLSQLAKDPWEDYFKTKQMMTGGMKRKIGAGTK